MDQKKCKRCGRILPIDEFYKYAKMADGHLSYCKDCTKKYKIDSKITDVNLNSNSM